MSLKKVKSSKIKHRADSKNKQWFTKDLQHLKKTCIIPVKFNA